MKSFENLNDSQIANLNARDECEQHCSNLPDCWGCTFHCDNDNDCKWIAISECNEFQVNTLGEGGATQKPGIHIAKVFLSFTMFRLFNIRIVLYIRTLISFPYL